jgi:hypothetical protein
VSSHDAEHLVGLICTVGVLAGLALVVVGAWAWDRIRGQR